MADTKIEWADAVWNCVRGCSRVSPGCGDATGGGCYAMRQAHRFSGPSQPYEGLTRIGKRGVDWSGRVRLIPEMLDAPLRWRKPRRVFVNSMSDLFHESLSNEQIAAVFGVMAATPRHTFQVLTKRADHMRGWFAWIDSEYARNAQPWKASICWRAASKLLGVAMPTEPRHGAGWPLPNVWLGVSAEDQQRADERIPHLLATPAAVRFVSAEPLIGWVELAEYLPGPAIVRSMLHHQRTGHPVSGGGYEAYCETCRVVWEPESPAISWCIAGGESGHGARPCDVAWIRSIVEQCRAAGVAAFVKQLGGHYVDAPNGIGGVQARPDPTIVPAIRRLVHRKGGDPSEWPEDLRVREWPVTT